MDSLLQLLKRIDAITAESQSPIYARFIDAYNSHLILEANALAEDLLITNNGQCNWPAINLLNENGYIVAPLEKDRYGWLIAGISTSKGLIIYG